MNTLLRSTGLLTKHSVHSKAMFQNGGNELAWGSGVVVCLVGLRLWVQQLA